MPRLWKEAGRREYILWPMHVKEEQEMITAKCVILLDSHKGEEWPRSFSVLPVIGHTVQSSSGKRLRVVGINHRPHRDSKDFETVVEIELG